MSLNMNDVTQALFANAIASRRVRTPEEEVGIRLGNSMSQEFETNAKVAAADANTAIGNSVALLYQQEAAILKSIPAGAVDRRKEVTETFARLRANATSISENLAGSTK